MKKRFLVFTIFSMSFFLTVTAQEKYDDKVAVGDELIIGEPSQSNYRFIDVPKKNFIIKRGGIANMASIMNNKVTVTKMKYDKNDMATVTFKPSNGRKFFNVYRTLSADLNGAISHGELKLKQASQKGEIAK